MTGVFDAGKKVTGRKRPVTVDTPVRYRASSSVPATCGIATARRRFPFIEAIRAGGGCRVPKMAATGARTGARHIKIVKRSDAPRFEAPPKRRIVERTFARIGRNGRITRDFQRHLRSVVAFIRLAMIRIRQRRLATTPSI